MPTFLLRRRLERHHGLWGKGRLLVCIAASIDRAVLVLRQQMPEVSPLRATAQQRKSTLRTQIRPTEGQLGPQTSMRSGLRPQSACGRPKWRDPGISLSRQNQHSPVARSSEANDATPHPKGRGVSSILRSRWPQPQASRHVGGLYTRLPRKTVAKRWFSSAPRHSPAAKGADFGWFLLCPVAPGLL